MSTSAIEASMATPLRRAVRAIQPLARARLVQFLAIGAAIFWIAPRPADDHRIEISARELATVEAVQAARDGSRALDPARAAEVTARVIEDRMLFREGVRMGLDQGDPIIEQRVVQKVLLLAESLGGATRDPSDAELRAAYAANRDRYVEPPRFHLMHVFAAREPDLPPAGALDPTALPAAGEPFPLPREVRATAAELRRSYGPAFADAVTRLAPSSTYSAPIASSFGWHRVRIVEIAAAAPLPFDAVKRQIGFELALARRQDAVRRFLDETAARYAISVAGAPVPHFQPLLRFARRDSASGED